MKIGDATLAAEALERQDLVTPVPGRILARALDVLDTEPDHPSTVPVLLRMLRHRLPVVREAAARALVSHLFPSVLRALDHVARHDRAARARAAAEASCESFWKLSVPCVHCGGQAILAPEPSSDPNAEQLPRPAFCDEACAAAWALDQVRDDWGSGPISP